MNLVSCSHVKRSRILALKARDLTKIRPLTFERISNRLRLNAQISIPATLKVSGKKLEERLPVSQSIIKAVSRPRFPYYARGRKMKFRSFHSGASQKAFDFQTAEHLACVNRACGSDRLHTKFFKVTNSRRFHCMPKQAKLVSCEGTLFFLIAWQF